MTREQAARQIARLSVFRETFPIAVEGKQELVDAAMRTGTDEHLLRLVIDDQVATGDRCFLPAELVRALRAHMAEPGQKPLGDPACQDCDGVGFVSRKVNGVWGAEPCPCRNLKEAKPSSAAQMKMSLA